MGSERDFHVTQFRLRARPKFAAAPRAEFSRMIVNEVRSTKEGGPGLLTIGEQTGTLAGWITSID